MQADIKNSDAKSFLGIKPEEFKVTFVAVAYFFFVIAAYYVIKPIRGSLALELGASAIPVLNILSMISLIAGNAIYSVIVGKYQRDVFIPFLTKFFIFCIFIFWCVFSFVFPLKQSNSHKVKVKGEKIGSTVGNKKAPVNNAKLALASVKPNKNKKIVKNIYKISTAKKICIGAYYLWVNLFALFAVSMFWSFMNDVFTVSQSKRLYAIIGYGGLIGGLSGGSITTFAVKYVGTSNLFLIAIALLYPSVLCMKYIHNRYSDKMDKRKKEREQNKKTEKPAHPPRPIDGFLEVIKAPVLIFMAFELFTYTFSSTMFFQQLNIMVENTFKHDLTARTAFISGVYTKINALSLVTQFFVTRLVMMLKNPIFGLLLLNLIQVIGTILMMFMPSLGVVSWAIIARYALNYSTGRAIRELVYIPLTREQKYQGKGFIDTVIFRLGDGLSSLLLIGGLHFFSYGRWIDYSILVSMAFQAFIIVKIAQNYAKRTAEKIEPA